MSPRVVLSMLWDQVGRRYQYASGGKRGGPCTEYGYLGTDRIVYRGV